jgi:6-phosphogluconolactonase (cycloisomerase 2 family)
VRLSISPDGKHAYVYNNNSVTLGIYSRNAVTGALTSISTISGAYGPQVLSSDGLNLYISSGSSGLITYSRNTTTGALTLLGTDSTYLNAGFMTNSMIAITSNDTSVFVTDYSSGNLYNYLRNPSTGLLSLSQTVSFAPYYTLGVTVSADGLYVYVALYDPNQTTGLSIVRLTRSLTSPYTVTVANTYTVAGAVGDQPQSLVLTKKQNLLICGGSGSTIYSWTRNTTTGALTANSDVSGFGAGLATNH